MAAVGTVTLGQVRLAAQQRSDKQNSPYVTTSEWNSYIASAAKELYDLLITTYTGKYFVAAPFVFATSGSNTTGLYPLPDGLTTTDAVTGLVAAAFYKLLGVDLQYSSSPSGWVALQRFQFQERNLYNFQNQYPLMGATNLHYDVVGSNIWLDPVPAVGQNIQLWYIPQPANLQTNVVCGTTASSSTVTTSDTSGLSVGMTVDLQNPLVPGTPVFVAGSTISSIVANTSFVVSGTAATTTMPYANILAWRDDTILQGISGWEELVIIEAAIRANIKEESDFSGLMQQKQAVLRRITDSAPNRDAGQPPCVTDSLALEAPRGYGRRW